MVERTSRGRPVDEAALGVHAVAPEPGQGDLQIARQSGGGLAGGGQIGLAAIRARPEGEQVGGLQALGLRPQPGGPFARAEVGVQAVHHRAPPRIDPPLAGLEQAPGDLRPLGASGDPAPLLQQPRPFEVMAGVEHTAGLARRRPPIGVEQFGQGAGRRVHEALAAEAADLVGDAGPARVLPDLAPAERGLEQVHLGVALEGPFLLQAVARG